MMPLLRALCCDGQQRNPEVPGDAGREKTPHRPVGGITHIASGGLVRGNLRACGQYAPFETKRSPGGHRVTRRGVASPTAPLSSSRASASRASPRRVSLRTRARPLRRAPWDGAAAGRRCDDEEVDEEVVEEVVDEEEVEEEVEEVEEEVEVEEDVEKVDEVEEEVVEEEKKVEEEVKQEVDEEVEEVEEEVDKEVAERCRCLRFTFSVLTRTNFPRCGERWRNGWRAAARFLAKRGSGKWCNEPVLGQNISAKIACNIPELRLHAARAERAPRTETSPVPAACPLLALQQRSNSRVHHEGTSQSEVSGALSATRGVRQSEQSSWRFSRPRGHRDASQRKRRVSPSASAAATQRDLCRARALLRRKRSGRGHSSSSSGSSGGRARRSAARRAVTTARGAHVSALGDTTGPDGRSSSSSSSGGGCGLARRCRVHGRGPRHRECRLPSDCPARDARSEETKALEVRRIDRSTKAARSRQPAVPANVFASGQAQRRDSRAARPPPSRRVSSCGCLVIMSTRNCQRPPPASRSKKDHVDALRLRFTQCKPAMKCLSHNDPSRCKATTADFSPERHIAASATPAAAVPFSANVK
ncbi:unnamed protein product [Lampetra planeri]